MHSGIQSVYPSMRIDCRQGFVRSGHDYTFSCVTNVVLVVGGFDRFY